MIPVRAMQPTVVLVVSLNTASHSIAGKLHHSTAKPEILSTILIHLSSTAIEVAELLAAIAETI